MPFVSQAQRGLFHAVEGNPAVAERAGISQATARKMIGEDKPGKLPAHVGRAEGGGLGSPHLHQQFGGVSFSEANPWWERTEERQIFDQPLRGGLIASSGAGRTDQIPASVASDSHVMPADVISGLGQGNTLNGARIFSAALRVGPYGTALPREVHGSGPPSHAPPRVSDRELGLGLASGGSNNDVTHGLPDHDETSVLLAGGEFHVPREDWIAPDDHGQLSLHAGVRTLGEGDLDLGHDRLNDVIHRVREHTMDFLKHAPPPKD